MIVKSCNHRTINKNLISRSRLNTYSNNFTKYFTVRMGFHDSRAHCSWRRQTIVLLTILLVKQLTCANSKILQYFCDKNKPLCDNKKETINYIENRRKTVLNWISALNSRKKSFFIAKVKLLKLSVWFNVKILPINWKNVN